MSVHAFKSLRSPSPADRRAREEASRVHVERQLADLVAAIPTKRAFDEWVGTFPAEYQADIRLRFSKFCTFPVAAPGVSPSSPLAAGAGQTGETLTTDGWSAPKDEDAAPVLNDFRQMGRLLDEDKGE